MDIDDARKKPERGCIRCGSECYYRGCSTCERQETYCLRCSQELDPGHEQRVPGQRLKVKR